VLSVFVSIAVAVNLIISRSSRVGLSDMVVTGALVLTMSKTAYAITLLLYLGTLLFGSKEQRKLVWKLLVVLALGLLLYFFLFPGLFAQNFSKVNYLVSILPRALDVIDTLGLRESFLFADDMLVSLGGTQIYREDETYSIIGSLLKSKWVAPFLFVIVAASVSYFRRVRQMNASTQKMYVVTLIACALVLFGVPYTGAPSFQFIAGFALFPMFKKMWSHSLAARGHGRGKIRNLSESVPVG
jgi:hypothetical protein